MTITLASSCALRLLSSWLVALLAAGPSSPPAPEPPGPSALAETLILSSGLSLEREIHGGETKSFDLSLSAGSFLDLEISPRDLRLSSALLDPGGRRVAAAEGSDPQILAMRVDRQGTYRLELAAHGTKVAERFGLKVLELRPVRPEDESRTAGAALLAEARRLSALKGEREKDRAAALVAESLAAWRKATDVRGEVEALIARAAIDRDSGDKTGALSWYGKALKRAEEGGLAKEQARVLGEMGACDTKLGKYPEAVELYRRSLEIWGRVGGPYNQAAMLQELGTCYLYKPDYEAALQTFKAAQAAADASGDLGQQGRVLSGLGASQYYLYQLEQARDTWEQALRLSRQAGDPGNEITIEQNLAVLYLNKGALQKALDLFLRLAPQASPEGIGLVRYNTGLAYLEMGNLEKAQNSFELSQAASHVAGDAEGEVMARIGIGRAHQRQGDPRSALAEYQKAESIFPAARWDVLHSIGLALIDLNRPGEALVPLQKALALSRASRSRSQESVTLLALGLADSALHRPDAAKESLDRAVAVGKEIGYQAVIAPALLRRALLSRDLGQTEAAQADVEDALSVVESTRRNIAGDQLRIGFSATKRTYYDLDVDLLLELGARHPDQERYRALAFEASERAKARGLLDLLAEGRIDLSQGLAPDLRQREAEIFSQLSLAERRLESAAKPERLKEAQAEIRRLDEQREQLDLEIRAKNQRYAEVRYPVPLRLEQIQSELLDDRTALLEYSLGEKHSTLFVITRRQIHACDLPAAGEIAGRVRRLRTALEHESLLTRRDYLDAAFQLYRDLLEPAASALEGHPDLLIVPDGVLYYVPFEALLTEPAKGRSYRDLPYLLRRHSIAYVPSVSVLAGLREPRQEAVQASRQQVAAFAPFVVTEAKNVSREITRDGSHPRFGVLPSSRREVSEITQLYSGAALSFVGDAATESAFKHDPAVAAARRLHLATHAQINEAQPELSALIFKPGNGEDGYLDVREIFGLKLSADLAVLSACETGLGKEVTGEGLIGLTRAFFYAGVPSLVVSLWNVVDGPTPDLMRDFYKGMDQFHDKSKALQSAKLAMVAQGTYAYPTYWASFILLGEPR